MQHERGCDSDSCFSLTCGLQPGETRSSLKKLLKCDPHGCWKPLALLDARVAAPLIRPLRAPLSHSLRTDRSRDANPAPGPAPGLGCRARPAPPPPREARREPPPRRATCLMAGAAGRDLPDLGPRLWTPGACPDLPLVSGMRILVFDFHVRFALSRVGCVLCSHAPPARHTVLAMSSKRPESSKTVESTLPTERN